MFITSEVPLEGVSYRRGTPLVEHPVPVTVVLPLREGVSYQRGTRAVAVREGFSHQRGTPIVLPAS